MVKFHIYNSYDNTYLDWVGKHTYGSCTIRGTCINFQPSSAKFIHESDKSNYRHSLIGLLTNTCHKCIDKDLDIKPYSFLKDCCSLRCRSLDDGISELKLLPINELVDIFNDKSLKINFEKDIDPWTDTNNLIYMSYIHYFNENEDEIKLSNGYSIVEDRIIYYFKYHEIIRELQKVKECAFDNEVFQDWI